MAGDGNTPLEADIPMTTEPATPKHDVKDIDASWDGKGSLDEHRQKVLSEVKQPGFGREVKTNGE